MSYEIEYVIPFEILFTEEFQETWEAKDAIFSTHMLSLLRLMNVELNSIELAEAYCSLTYGQGDVHVFYDSAKEKFIVFDLYFSYTDQHNMITLGVHVTSSIKEITKMLMLQIYKLADNYSRSDFKEYSNNKLLMDINPAIYPKEILDCKGYSQNIIFH